MKRIALFCSHCKQDFVLGHIIKAFWIPETNETLLVHGFCERAFLAENEVSES